MNPTLRMFVFTLISLAFYTEAAGGRVSIDGQDFIDDHGRQLVFRGANAGSLAKFSAHNMPFDLPVDYSESDLSKSLETYTQFFSDHGFNIARITLMHSAAAPAPGIYNSQYFQLLGRLVQAFGDRGVYVILDGHQDLFSARFCGDGFADWMLPVRWQNRKPPGSCRLWELRYFSPGVTTAFHQFWTNRRGIQDHYIDYLGEVARRFGHHQHVLGIEPMNEPVPGYGILYNPLAGFQYRSWAEERLYDFYKRAAKAVHEQNSELLIFGDLGPAETLGWAGSRFRNPEIPQFALAPHFYQVTKPGYRDGKAKIPITPETSHEIRQSLVVKLRLAEKWRVPAIIGEYGAEMGVEQAGEYLALINRALDDQNLSAIVWEASLGDSIWNGRDKNIMTPEGDLRESARVLNRPYPQAVAGQIESFNFDHRTGEFSLSYHESTTGQVETQIYFPHAVDQWSVQPPRPIRQEGSRIYIQSLERGESIRVSVKAADYSSNL